MREGLRSGKVLLIPEKDRKYKVSANKNVQNEMKETVSDSDGKENPHLILSNVENERESLVVGIEKKRGALVKECIEDGEENERKRRVGGGEESEHGGVVKKKVKEEEGLDCKLHIGGRILRSGFVVKSGGNEESDKGVCERGFSGKGTGSDGREMNKVKVEIEEIDLGVGNLKMNLKRKRGRPPKTEKNRDQSVGRLKKKSKRGRGRPPKLKESNKVLKAELDKRGKVVGLRKGGKDLKLRDSVKRNAPSTSSYSEKRYIGKELNVKRFSPAKKNKSGKDLETEDNKASLRLSPRMTNASSVKKQKSEGGKANQEDEVMEPSRLATKNLVRDKITDLLFSAGWTVEYRPRFERAYNDAVYVSPDGKTHWSVTLAYRVLKKHYEAGNGESKIYKAGFVFTPIPEEEFGILKRVVSKTRADKNKKRKDGDKTGVMEKRRHKEKPSSIMSPGSKSIKGRMKRKSLLHEQDSSAGTSQEVLPISVRGHKRRQTQNKKRCALLVRNTKEGVDSDVDGYILYNGKRTVLAWMIDLGMVSLNGKVQFMNQRRTRVRLEGRITRDGIHCDCCSEIIPISKFEAHAGSNPSRPYQNIFLETGTSLLQCLLDSWNKQEESQCKGFHFIDVDGEDPNDDTCGICGDGGDLICCDGCPSTFHQSCLDIENFPSGDWHCVYCSCKFCGMGGENTYERHDNDDISSSALLKCCLCEEKFHQSCIRAGDATSVDSSCPSFCGKKCQELFERLRMLLGVKHELEGGFSWTLIHRSDVGSDIYPNEIPPEVEWNSKLAVAFFIMDECFLPVVDHRSGVNLIHNILYNCGSNFTRLNYSGFFTVILERGDEIISAASIRIHGNQLAEMPFIGTRHMYRRQGMCRRLLTAVESVLYSLNVEKLVIPAISELRETWTSVFGFKALGVSAKQKMRNMNMLVFPGIDMLQKPLLKHQFAEDSMIPTQGMMSTEFMAAHNTDARYSTGLDLNVSIRAPAAHAHDRNEPTALESCSQLLDGSLNDTSDKPGETVDLPKCVTDMKCQIQIHVTHNNLEESETVVKPLDSVYDANGPTEEIREYQIASVIRAPDEKTMELDSQSDHESKLLRVSHIGSEASDCVKPFVISFGEDTDNVDCEMKIEDGIVEHNPNSCDEASICHSAETIMTQPRDVACVDGSEVSGENIVLHNLEAASQMSLDAKDIKHSGSQQLQEVGSVIESDGRMLDTREGKISHAAVQHMSIALDEVDPSSTGCSGSQILPKTSNISCDEALPTLASACMVHPISSVCQRGQTVMNGFPVDSNIIASCQGNGLDTHESDVSAAVEGRHHFSCEVSLNPITKPNLQTCMSNGACMITEIAFDSHEVVVDGVYEEKEAAQTIFNSTGQDLVLERPQVKSKSSKQFESGSQVEPISSTQCNSKSSEQCESDHQIDHASITLCNSESMCNLSSASDVALHCATNGGNSCGTPEVIALSNQAS
ncbi:uncharacterized protein LOC132172844 [Corylus avellana]|uniref:uncharacterized protein LOC132172844 n=1 Tax=Corylus avellana TaxID=13451 RepID=UPI00286CD59C|nr:uncharacterized protein LOC132172844 [Corylus avellana]